MLEVRNIHKQYKTGNFIQVALDDVSLNLRDHEFVSILGPSGSGKTTLLNMIGGLDHYDSGDILIDHVSTKDYKDRDWDSYRSHSVGFIFQSYNLIPHQTLLENVELALTISNVPPAERKKRAAEALGKVGLKEHMHKKPNQLSGGQMQRVAIARALVNNPKIILADEPTGALDSKTSVQVMELLKEVAKDRLVVMVTHNPDLAHQYSTRIVELKDGVLVSDSDPYVLEEKDRLPGEKKNFGRVGMSLLTAMRLSFNNLLSKRKRTLLVAFAGSIGIIGIALIMALSNGANDYIQSMEEETLSQYPLEISKTTLDFTSMLTLGMQMTSGSSDEADDQIHEEQVISSMFGTVQENNLAALKEYLDSEASDIDQYVNAVEYSYDVTPYLYRISDSSVRRVSPSSLFESLGYSSSTSLYGSSMSVFKELPEETSLYESAYEVVAGKWPENSNELVVVLDSGNGLSDLALYNLGLKDISELESLINDYTTGNYGATTVSEAGTWSYSDILGLTLNLVNASDLYEYDSSVGCYSEVSSEEEETIARNGETLTIVGIVRPLEDSTSPILSQGIFYTHDLIQEIVAAASESEIVQKQLADPDTNVFTGKAFDDTDSDFDLSSLFSVDEDAISSMMSFDADSLSMDTSAFNNLSLDLSGLDLSSLTDDSSLSGLTDLISADTISQIFEGVTIDITPEKLSGLFTDLYTSFTESVSDDPSLDVSALSDAYSAYFTSDEFNALLKNYIQQAVNEQAQSAILASGDFQSAASALIQGYSTYCTDNSLDPSSTDSISAYLSSTEASSFLSSMSQAAVAAVTPVVTSEDFISGLVQAISDGYTAYAETNNYPMVSKILEAFENYLTSEEALSLIGTHAEEMIDTDQLSSNIESVVSSAVGAMSDTISQAMSSIMSSLGTSIASQLQSAISSMMTGYMSQMTSAFSFDSLSDLISIDMSAEKMQSILTTMMGSTSTDAASNLTDLGYADLSDPESITFYPIDFDSKNAVINILNEYNDAKEALGADEDVVSFTDTVGTLMSSVTTIVDIIGYVLIAFVSISLVVSSIMIGVITYISVLERRKEIGILRAMGASKHNITEVFNSETIITGFLAGAIGVLLTWLLLIPGNAILQAATGEESLHAFLPVSRGVILVLLSIVLTTIGGLLPSKSAARQDPVNALRSE